MFGYYLMKSIFEGKKFVVVEKVLVEKKLKVEKCFFKDVFGGEKKKKRVK